MSSKIYLVDFWHWYPHLIVQQAYYPFLYDTSQQLNKNLTRINPKWRKLTQLNPTYRNEQVEQEHHPLLELEQLLKHPPKPHHWSLVLLWDTFLTLPFLPLVLIFCFWSGFFALVCSVEVKVFLSLTKNITAIPRVTWLGFFLKNHVSRKSRYGNHTVIPHITWF